jgi:hypothetical protein
MEEINTTEVTSTLEEKYVITPVKAKQEWLQNAFKKKEYTETQPHPRPGNDLVQDRHRWIQEELQLRKTLKSQGKSDLAITRELVQARQRWLDDERKKYQEAVIISPGVNSYYKRSKKFLQEENKEDDIKPHADGATVVSSTTEKETVVSQDVVEARKKWLEEEAFGTNWQQFIAVEGNASMLSTLSMQTKVGLANVSEDQVNVLGPVSPREALRLTFEETNTLKTAHTSECDEDLDDFEGMLTESNSPISNEKRNDNTTMGDSYNANVSEREISDEIESPMNNEKTNQNSNIAESDKERVVHADVPKIESVMNNEKTNQNSNIAESDKERVVHADVPKIESVMNNEKTNQNSNIAESDKERVVHADVPRADTSELGEIRHVPSGEHNMDDHSDKDPYCRQEDLILAPTDERLGLSTYDPRLEMAALSDETPPYVDRGNWKLVRSDSDPVETPCLEVCSIL